MLYGAISRAAFALGYNKVISFILCEETGHSLKCANWKCVGKSGGGSWSRPSRKRTNNHPLQEKLKFQITAGVCATPAAQEIADTDVDVVVEDAKSV
jgi:hypothetical protein